MVSLKFAVFPTLLLIVSLLASFRTEKTTSLKKTVRVLEGTATCLDDDGITNAINAWFSERGNATIDYGPIGAWQTCNVADFRGLFLYKTLFNGDISQWDTSRGTNMHRMFSYASSFNGDIRGWDVSRVQYMVGMFNGASSFNRCLEWDVSTKYTENMFFGSNVKISERCPCLDCLSNISLRKAVEEWFVNRTAVKAEYGPMNGWRCSEVSDLYGLFDFYRLFYNKLPGKFPNKVPSFGNVSGWDVSAAEDMGYMFHGSPRFNEDLSGWDCSRVTSMHGMFWGASSFNGNVNGWDVSSLTDVYSMFANANNFNMALSEWDVSRVTSLYGMFWGAQTFNGDISMWNIQATDMNSMFADAFTFNVDISAWNIIPVTTMYGMFEGAKSFNQVLKWNVGRKNTLFMFDGSNGKIS